MINPASGTVATLQMKHSFEATFKQTISGVLFITAEVARLIMDAPPR